MLKHRADELASDADLAIERGYVYYFWGHSDAAVLARDESALFADDVIACVESSFKSRPKWGIIYFNYDWFSAIRTDLVRQVGAEDSTRCKVSRIARPPKHSRCAHMQAGRRERQMFPASLPLDVSSQPLELCWNFICQLCRQQACLRPVHQERCWPLSQKMYRCGTGCRRSIHMDTP